MSGTYSPELLASLQAAILEALKKLDVPVADNSTAVISHAILGDAEVPLTR